MKGKLYDLKELYLKKSLQSQNKVWTPSQKFILLALLNAV